MGAGLRARSLPFFEKKRRGPDFVVDVGSLFVCLFVYGLGFRVFFVLRAFSVACVLWMFRALGRLDVRFLH